MKNQNYKLKRYEIDPKEEKFFFHNFIGEVVDPFDPTMDYFNYELDEDYIKLKENEV